MIIKSNYLDEIVIRTIVTIVCCLAIGYIFFQSQIFNYRLVTFMIPVYGSIGAIFFYSLRVNTRNAFAALLVLIVINSGFITHSCYAK